MRILQEILTPLGGNENTQAVRICVVKEYSSRWKGAVKEMKKYALLGHPLGHSVSHIIHSELFKLTGHNGTYEYADVPIEKLDQWVAYALRAYAGFNITAPYKKDIIKYLSSISDKADLYSSVNCVNCNDRKGHNTDCDGFWRAMDEIMTVRDKAVLLCGFGGTGKMLASELMLEGARLDILVREQSLERTMQEHVEILEKIHSRYNINPAVRVVTSVDADDYALLINATTLGRGALAEKMPVSTDILSHLKESLVAVYDVNYNPLVNNLLKTAYSNGIPFKNGLGMLIHQAARSHEIWYNAEFKTDYFEHIHKVLVSNSAFLAT
jgi:shikimate dehydrogenase